MRNLLLACALLLLLSACDTLLGSSPGKNVTLPAQLKFYASSATASSSFGGKLGGNRDDQSAFAATGEPDVNNCTDDPHAWTPDGENVGVQWLELTFPRDLYLSSVRIRESLAPGAVTKVEARSDAGLQTLWEGKDPNKDCPGWFEVIYSNKDGNITRSMTPFKTDTVRITLDTDVPGWNEIDTVQVTGYDQRWYFFNDTLTLE